MRSTAISAGIPSLGNHSGPAIFTDAGNETFFLCHSLMFSHPLRGDNPYKGIIVNYQGQSDRRVFEGTCLSSGKAIGVVKRKGRIVNPPLCKSLVNSSSGPGRSRPCDDPRPCQDRSLPCDRDPCHTPCQSGLQGQSCVPRAQNRVASARTLPSDH